MQVSTSTNLVGGRFRVTRARHRRAWAALAVVAFACAGVTLACASDEVDAVGPSAAGGDAALDGESGALPADPTASPAGDPCGARGGLQAGAPWPLRGGCPKRAGVLPGAGPQSATLQWSVPIAAGDSSPAVDAAGLVWLGTAGGDVLAVSSGGVVLGALHTPAAVRASVALAATGLAIVGGTDGVLYALGELPAQLESDAAIRSRYDPGCHRSMSPNFHRVS